MIVTILLLIVLIIGVAGLAVVVNDADTMDL